MGTVFSCSGISAHQHVSELVSHVSRHHAVSSCSLVKQQEVHPVVLDYQIFLLTVPVARLCGDVVCLVLTLEIYG